MRLTRFSAAALALAAFASAAHAADIRIAVMQAQAGEARRYQPLLQYLSTKGISASFVTARDARDVDDMFGRGDVDAMFGGSGLAGTMILRGLAVPLSRPVPTNGPGTYHAVVVAPKGSARFSGSGAYFDGKRVIFTPLASAGELYLRSLGPSRPAAELKAASHGAAIDALARGRADVAVVKNHVWNAEKAKYPALEQVGEDSGENPDGSLIVSKRLAPATATALADALLALRADRSAAAAAAKERLVISGFVAATEADFAHTLALLTKAGVAKDSASR